MFGWILAKFYLASMLVLYWLKIPFRRRGMRQFLQFYGPEGLLPLSLSEKATLREFSACINCGLCDQACPALWKLPRERFPGPSALVLAWSRMLPPIINLDLDLSWCEGCSRCESVCPYQIPIKQVPLFLDQQRDQLQKFLNSTGSTAKSAENIDAHQGEGLLNHQLTSQNSSLQSWSEDVPSLDFGTAKLRVFVQEEFFPAI